MSFSTFPTSILVCRSQFKCRLVVLSKSFMSFSNFPTSILVCRLSFVVCRLSFFNVTVVFNGQQSLLSRIIIRFSKKKKRRRIYCRFSFVNVTVVVNCRLQVVGCGLSHILQFSIMNYRLSHNCLSFSKWCRFQFMVIFCRYHRSRKYFRLCFRVVGIRFLNCCVNRFGLAFFFFFGDSVIPKL